MDCINVGIGQYCIVGFWDYWDIENDMVVFVNVYVFEDICYMVGVVMQFLIGDVLSGFFWVIRFLDDCGLIVVCCQMMVNVVGGYVQCVICILVDIYIVEIIVDVFDLGKRFDLIDLCVLFVLEFVRVFD